MEHIWNISNSYWSKIERFQGDIKRHTSYSSTASLFREIKTKRNIVIIKLRIYKGDYYINKTIYL